MKVAIVHDWLVTYAGAERVLEQIIHIWPDADLFAVVDFLPTDQRGFIQNKPVRTSFIQRFPKAKTHYRHYLPFMPIAIEQFDLSAYDVVISSSHAVAKGVLTGPDQLHICYCHTPIRYAWDLQHQYLAQSGLNTGLKSIVVRYLLHRIRLWDARTANGVDVFVANSQYIARRIDKVYRRQAEVVYPNVDTDYFIPATAAKEPSDYYLTASRLVPYKKIDLLVQAFNAMPDKKLVVIGDGPDMEKIQALAGPNIQLVGYQPQAALLDFMQQAKAFVFAAEEDFGIVVVEAQACGVPVIAYGKGGATETVVQGETGWLYPEQNSAAVQNAVQQFEQQFVCEPQRIRHHALRFSTERFKKQFQELVQTHYSQFKQIDHEIID